MWLEHAQTQPAAAATATGLMRGWHSRLVCDCHDARQLPHGRQQLLLFLLLAAYPCRSTVHAHACRFFMHAHGAGAATMHACYTGVPSTHAHHPHCCTPVSNLLTGYPSSCSCSLQQHSSPGYLQQQACPQVHPADNGDRQWSEPSARTGSGCAGRVSADSWAGLQGPKHQQCVPAVSQAARSFRVATSKSTTGQAVLVSNRISARGMAGQWLACYGSGASSILHCSHAAHVSCRVASTAVWPTEQTIPAFTISQSAHTLPRARLEMSLDRAQYRPVATLFYRSGCFWCLEACYQQLKGVSSVVSGYAGGHVENPTYSQVSMSRSCVCVCVSLCGVG